MIRRLITFLSALASSHGEAERAGGGSSSLPLPAHHFPPRVERRIAVAPREYEDRKAKSAEYRAKFEKECIL